MTDARFPSAVIPAKAGIHRAFPAKGNMDSRVRGDDGRVGVSHGITGQSQVKS